MNAGRAIAGRMTASRVIVGSSLAALFLMAVAPGTPLTFLVVFAFLLCCPGIMVGGQLDLSDRALTGVLLVSSSLAIDALVAESFVYLHAFTGTRVVVTLAVLSIAGALLRRPVASTTATRPFVRSARAAAARYQLDFDRSTPVILLRVGHYPVYHGGVCAIRSFGRVGVPVHAVVEDRLTPAAASRYLESAHVWPTTGAESEEFLVEGLCRIGRDLGGRPLAIPTDDESAVLLAEHGDVLREHFMYPDVDSRLPRRLSNKEGLHIMCGGYGVSQPDAFFPRTENDIFAYAARATFPIVVKNVGPFARLHEKAVGGTTVVHSPGELIRLAHTFPTPRSAMFQEYIPREDAEDWIFQTYCDENYDALVPFTGIKLRSWPPHAGVTAYARAVRNEELEEVSVNFLRDIGYRGVCDLDWQFDRRDGRYKLVDFNPRPGAQFELFATDAGVDVLRAMHLDMTGREVPTAPARSAGIRVEHLDLPSAIAYRRGHEPVPEHLEVGGRADPAWMAPDDPVPFFVMMLRVAGPAARRVVSSIRQRPSSRPSPTAHAKARRGGALRKLAPALLVFVAIAGVVFGIRQLTSASNHAAPHHASVGAATVVSVADVSRSTVTLALRTERATGPVHAIATQAVGAPTAVWSSAGLPAGTARVVVPFPTARTTITVNGMNVNGHPLRIVLDPAALQARLGIHCVSAACAWLGH